VRPGNILYLICLSDESLLSLGDIFQNAPVLEWAAMMCQERIRLVADYRETTRTYADFVRKLTDLVGLGIETEVDVLRRSCRLAWEAAEKARLALFRHEADHSCNRSDFHTSAAAAGFRQG
jgi:hypothetical protein